MTKQPFIPRKLPIEKLDWVSYISLIDNSNDINNFEKDLDKYISSLNK